MDTQYAVKYIFHQIPLEMDNIRFRRHKNFKKKSQVEVEAKYQSEDMNQLTLLIS